MQERDLDAVLDGVPRNADGSYRGMASFIIPGDLIGPVRYAGTRKDHSGTQRLHSAGRERISVRGDLVGRCPQKRQHIPAQWQGSGDRTQLLGPACDPDLRYNCISVAQRAWIVTVCLMASVGAVRSDEPGVVAHVTLERLVKGDWEAVNSHIVLRGGERARFVFRSNSVGRLYVVQCSPPKDCRWLGEGKPIEAGRDYIIPEEGFEVRAEPGYDTTYWVLSPEAMSRKATPGAPGMENDKTLPPPHCVHLPLVKRRACEAPDAGPHLVPPITPQWFEKGGSIESQYVNIDDTKPSVRILMSADFDQPLVYAFRIAHE